MRVSQQLCIYVKLEVFLDRKAKAPLYLSMMGRIRDFFEWRDGLLNLLLCRVKHSNMQRTVRCCFFGLDFIIWNRSRMWVQILWEWKRAWQSVMEVHLGTWTNQRKWATAGVHTNYWKGKSQDERTKLTCVRRLLSKNAKSVANGSLK